MKDFLLLFKTLYKAQNAKMLDNVSGKRKLSQQWIMLIGLTPLALLLVAFLVYISYSITDIRHIALISNTVLFAVQIMTLFMSLTSIVTTLYNAKDTPMLNSLPLRPTSVFFAKFALLYVNAIKFSGAILFVMLLAPAITFNVVTGSMFYAFYPLVFVIVLVAPILPLFIATLLSMPLVYIGSFFKGKSILKSVFAIIFYVVLMAGYMVFIYFANTTDFGEGNIQLSQGAIAGLSGIANAMYPDKVLINFCFGIDFGKNFGISIGITVGMVAVMILLALFFYRRINMRSVEGNVVGQSKGEVSFKQSKIVPSLVRKDFSLILRNSTLAMSSLANLILAPLFIVVMYLIFSRQNSTSPADEQIPEFTLHMMNIGFAMMYSMIFLGGANMLSGLAYTREGRSFFASKALPIRPIDSIKAKLITACIPPAIVEVVIMLIMIFLHKVDIVSVLISGIDIMLVVVGISSLNIIFDMRKGNQYWTDASELRSTSKANTYQLISAFVAIVPAIIIFGIGIVLSFVPFDKIVCLAIYWTIATIICAVVCLVGVLVLKNQGEKCYEMIGEHKLSPKNKNRQQFKGLMNR